MIEELNAYHVKRVAAEKCHRVEHPLEPTQQFVVVHNPEVADH